MPARGDMVEDLTRGPQPPHQVVVPVPAEPGPEPEPEAPPASAGARHRLRLIGGLGLFVGLTAHMTHGLFQVYATVVGGLSPAR